MTPCRTYIIILKFLKGGTLCASAAGFCENDMNKSAIWVSCTAYSVSEHSCGQHLIPEKHRLDVSGQTYTLIWVSSAPYHANGLFLSTTRHNPSILQVISSIYTSYTLYLSIYVTTDDLFARFSHVFYLKNSSLLLKIVTFTWSVLQNAYRYCYYCSLYV